MVPASGVLTNQAIVELAAAGFTRDFLIDLILKSRTEFDTSVSALAGLAKQGVDEKIIRAMLKLPADVTALSSSDAKSAASLADEEALSTSASTPPQGWTSSLSGLFRKFGIRFGTRGSSPLIPQAGARDKGVIEIESVDLPRAIQGLAYSATIRSSVDGQCPRGNVGLFLAGGSLPRGLRTTDSGIAGVPMEMGHFKFSIGAHNTCASTARGVELLVTGRPILRAIPDRVEFTVSPDGQPDAQTVLISSTWPGLPYALSAPNDSWLTTRQVEGTTPEAGSAFVGDRATVTIIPTKLAPGVHHARIIAAAWRANPVTIEVTVTVTMPKPAPEPAPWDH
jgi:hypothetical protein